MSVAASDKARFYMEQSVPELQEYERKKIFSREEITSIARKRSEFEHLINTPGASTPADYARYAHYEMNLDALRKKRSKRLGVKATAFAGQKKIFFVLERGVRKFQGDMALWMQYLDYCRTEAANRKLAKALTQCLRLHPVRWELWTWAAKYYFEQQADMQTARSYMQRGLRFCKRERLLWLEYARLEMLYVAKIAARRKVLGLDLERAAAHVDSSHDPDADMIALPHVTADEVRPEGDATTEAVDETALKKMAASPALSGDIPVIIFDTAMRDFSNDPTLAELFFDVFSAFTNVPCAGRLLSHIVSHLADHASQDTDRMAVGSNTVKHVCLAKLELVNYASGDAVQSADFPLQLGKALAILKQGQGGSAKHDSDLAEKSILLLLPYLRFKARLDDEIETVLRASIVQYLRRLHSVGHERVNGMIKRLSKAAKENEAAMLVELAAQTTN